MSNPIEDPGLYNYITLDGAPSPGLAELEGGGERSQKVENQQAPGFAGATTVFKGEEISDLTYRLTFWTVEHFAAWDIYAPMLRAGTKKRPPRVYALSDPAVSHNEIKAVAVVTVGPLKKIGPSKWAVIVKFTEYRKAKPTGGPIKPAQTKADVTLEAGEARNQGLRAQLAGASASASKQRK